MVNRLAACTIGQYHPPYSVDTNDGQYEPGDIGLAPQRLDLSRSVRASSLPINHVGAPLATLSVRVRVRIGLVGFFFLFIFLSDESEQEKDRSASDQVSEPAPHSRARPG